MTGKRLAAKGASNLKPGDGALVFEEPVPYEFDFAATVKAHGWVALCPFDWDEASATLTRIHRLDGGTAVRLHLTSGQSRSKGPVKIRLETANRLKAGEQAEIRRAVRRMLRLDEDLSEFHQLNSQLENWHLDLRRGTGRLLRCPRLFEDIVYTLCTTNIAWSGTKRMVGRLASSLGDSLPGSNQDRAFPSAEAIAAVDPQFLRQEAGLGYRSQYVWEFASAVAGGQLDLTAFEDPGHASDELYRLLRQIKGVGDYAAATILMLLGRYDRLAIDSELRAFVTKKYFDNQPVDAGQIRAVYAPWGRWQYLAYWFDASG